MIAAMTAVVSITMPAAVRRFQPVRRLRASTIGFSANANSAAIASDDSVRGIDRMNQTAIANSATAIASGMAERGSRSMPSGGVAGVGVTGERSSAEAVEGPGGRDATSVSYEPML